MAQTISSKGWVVIPADLRKKYGLKPGDAVHVVDYGGVLMLVPAHKDPINEGRGLLKGRALFSKIYWKSAGATLRPKSGSTRLSPAMKRTRPAFILDTNAFLSFLLDEPAASIVDDKLSTARAGGCLLLMSAMSVGEVCYIVERRRGVEDVGESLALLDELPVQIVDLDRPAILGAAHIKAGHPISLADAFVVALAISADATVITGDPEFKRVEHLVPVLWLPGHTRLLGRRRDLGGESSPDGVLGDHPGLHELQQVVRAAGLRAHPAHAGAAERLAPHHGAGDRPVDVEVAHPELPGRPHDVGRVAGVEAAGEAVA